MEAMFSTEAFEFTSQSRIKDLMTVEFMIHFSFSLVKLFIEKIAIILVELGPFFYLLFAWFRILV